MPLKTSGMLVLYVYWNTLYIDMLVLSLLEHPVQRYIGYISIEKPCKDMLILCLLKHPVYQYIGSISAITTCI